MKLFLSIMSLFSINSFGSISIVEKAICEAYHPVSGIEIILDLERSSPNSYSLKINGIEVNEISAGGSYYEAGDGYYFPTPFHSRHFMGVTKSGEKFLIEITTEAGSDTFYPRTSLYQVVGSSHIVYPTTHLHICTTLVLSN